MSATILAWHGDPGLKSSTVERMKHHRDADMFIQGNYFRHTADDDPRPFLGCFHGCLTGEALAAEQAVDVGHANSFSRMSDLDFHRLHEMYPDADWVPEWFHGERLWGIPVKLAEQLDLLFEQRYAGSLRDTADWAVAVTEAIPVGADLSGVADAFRAGCDDVPPEAERGLMLRLLAAAPVPGPVPA